MSMCPSEIVFSLVLNINDGEGSTINLGKLFHLPALLENTDPENKHVSCQHLATGFSYILRPELSVIILSSLGWDLVNK